MPYADQPRSLTRNAPKNGRGGAAYRAALAVVRERVRAGALCWFWRKPGHEACPGRIDLRLPANHRWALTGHHLHRLMDGGSALPARPSELAPAHRACNARDGLIAQNARRAALRARGVGGVRRAAGVPTGSGTVQRSAGARSTATLSEERRDRRSQAW